MQTTIKRWEDVAQKGDTCAVLLPIAQAEAEQLRAALLALNPKLDVKQWRRTPGNHDNDIHRFVHLRRELDKLNNEIARAA